MRAMVLSALGRIDAAEPELHAAFERRYPGHVGHLVVARDRDERHLQQSPQLIGNHLFGLFKRHADQLHPAIGGPQGHLSAELD